MTDKRIRIIVEADKAKAEVKSLDREVDRLDQSAKSTNDSFFRMAKVAAAVGAALVVSKVTQYADAFTSVQNQLRQTVRSSEELADVTERVLDVANRSRADLSATAELYTQLNLSTEDLGLSQEKLLRITETINKSFAVSGKTTEEANGAIRQLSQGLAAGALRGDEFNSVAEGAPEIMRAIARETGLTIGALREFAAEGKITTELLIRALDNAAETIDTKLDNSVQTLGQSMTLANNNMTAFIGSNETVQEVTRLAGESVLFLSENLDSIVRIAEVLAVAMGSRLVIAAGAATAAFVRTQIQALATAGAMGTLRSAAALLGGPAGIISIVAGSLFYFVTESIRSRDAALELADGIDTAKVSFENFDKLVAQKNLENVTAELEEARATLDRYIQRQESGLGSGNRYNKVIEDLEGQISKLTKAQRELNNQLLIGQQYDIDNLTGPEIQGRLDSTNKQLVFMQGVLEQVQSRFADGLATKEGVDRIQSMVDQLQKASDFFRSALGGQPETPQREDPQDDSDSKRLERIRENSRQAVMAEQQQTESLRLELATRRQIQTAYDQVRLVDARDYFAREKALIQAQFEEEMALANQRRTEQSAAIVAEREKVLADTMLTEEAKKTLLAELREQEKISAAEHQSALTEIERNAADQRIAIMQQEAALKAEGQRRAAEISLESNFMLANGVIGILEQLNGKSRALAKIGLVVKAAEGVSSAIINSQVAATRALAELGPIAGPPVASKMILQGKIAAGIIAANAALKLGGAGGGSASFGGGGIGGSVGATAAPQPQPIQQTPQTNVVEIRGLEKLADELANMDPRQVIPVEYAQQIVGGLAEYNRLSGEDNG